MDECQHKWTQLCLLTDGVLLAIVVMVGILTRPLAAPASGFDSASSAALESSPGSPAMVGRTDTK